MDDLQVQIKAILDVDKEKSESNINNSIEKKIQKEINKIKVELTVSDSDVQNIIKNINKALKQISVGPIKIDFSQANTQQQIQNQVKGVEQLNNTLKATDDRLKTIKKSATTVNEILTSTTNVKSNVSGSKSIIETKKYGMDEQTGERVVKENIEKVVADYKKEAQAIEKAKKEQDKLNESVSKYQRQIEELHANYSDKNATKAITGDSLEKLVSQYEAVLGKIEAYRNSSKEAHSQAEINVNNEISAYKQLVGQLQRAGYTANKLAPKSVESTVKEEQSNLNTFVNKINSSRVSFKDLSDDVSLLKQRLSEVGGDKQKLADYLNLLSSVKAKFNELNTGKRVQINSENLKIDKNILNNNIKFYLKQNTKLSDELKNKIYQIQQAITNADKTKLTQLQKEFRSVQKEAQALGQAGLSFVDNLKEKAAKFGQWMSLTSIIASFGMSVRTAITELQDMDEILTEISKTSDRSKQSLLELGELAPEVANKYGATITGYLTAVQEMNRAGFQGKTGDKLAELSLLTQTAGDVTADVANNYILATNAAYDFKGNAEKLTTVLDGQNQINIIVCLFRNK